MSAVWMSPELKEEQIFNLISKVYSDCVAIQPF